MSSKFREQLQYRAAALAGFGTQLFWGFIRLMIFAAFYASTTAAQPMTFEQVVLYVWLGQAFLGLLPWNIDRDIEVMVRTGAVAYELLRPMDTYTLWFFRTIAWRLARTTLRVIPMVVVAGFGLNLLGLERWAWQAPPAWTSAVMFCLAMIVAVLLGGAITMLMHVLLMWTVAAEGVKRGLPAIVTLLSGSVIPLPLFPDWAQPLLNVLPFRGLVDVPFRIYSGNIPPAEALAPIALTAMWMVAIVLGGRALMSRGFRRLVIQGG